MPAEPTPGPDDEGNSHGDIVGEHAVRSLAVLAETLSVIGRNDDERLFQRSRADIGEKAPHHRIRVRHFRIVRSVLRRVGLWGAIRLVWVV